MGKKRAARLWAAVCALTLITVSWAGAVGLPNPVREATAREIQERMGAPVAVPQGAQDVAYSLIDMTDEEEIAQVQFTLDGIQYCFRTQPGDGLTDISGMYYEWTKEDLAPLPGLEAEAHYNEGEAGILLWYHQGRGLACSVSMDTGATLEALVALAQPVAAGQNAEAEPMALTYDLEGKPFSRCAFRQTPPQGISGPMKFPTRSCWPVKRRSTSLMKTPRALWEPGGRMWPCSLPRRRGLGPWS